MSLLGLFFCFRIAVDKSSFLDLRTENKSQDMTMMDKYHEFINPSYTIRTGKTEMETNIFIKSGESQLV